MKRIFEKIGYFLLGGIVATIGYVAGGMNNSVAQQDIGYFRQLHVQDTLIVGDITSTKQTHVIVDASKRTASIMLIKNKPKGMSLKESDAVATVMASADTRGKPYSTLNLRDKSGAEYQVNSFDSLSNNVSRNSITTKTPSQTRSIIVEVMARHTGVVAKKVMLVSADVKMSNGKRIHVKFTNPQTTGMFGIYDNIRIRQQGSKWEFIEHIPK